ncbi:MAG TPA: ABC transporter permease [Candidatus Entotheonella sp.]|jgi:peptide/nickel transport system permease protein
MKRFLLTAVAVGEAVPAAPAKARSETLWAQTSRRLKRSHTAIFGLLVVIALILVAAFADVLAPYSATDTNPNATFQLPSSNHLLGTDQLGRDMLSRIIYGSRVSLTVGLSSVVLAVFIGLPLGLIAGYYGRLYDTLVMRAMDVILSFPVILLAIIIMVMFTPTDGFWGIIKVTMAVAIVRIPIYARLVRGSVLSIKEKEYIEACHALGQRDVKVLLKHILPNCLAPLIVAGTLSVATAIIVEASLSFLGVGIQPPTPSWGWDLKANVAWIQDNAWLALAPGFAIFITVLSFNLFGDGLRDALDPRLK